LLFVPQAEDAPVEEDLVVDVDHPEAQGGELWDETLVAHGKSTEQLEWRQWYEECPTFGDVCNMCHAGGPWPEGYSLAAAGNSLTLRRLVKGNTFCIPKALTPYVIREYHESTGHGGQEKLLQGIPSYYTLAVSGKVLKDLVRRMVSTCVICQAFKQPVRDLAVKARATPVPMSVGDHVAIDVFHMTRVRSEGVYYDCLILVVDVLSGYTMTFPMTLSGLTGAKAAKKMFTEWVKIFGVPSLITTDNGPQFTGTWWKTTCSLFGVRRAYCHAYHHQANGTAERTGKELKSWLSRVTASTNMNWVDALPYVQALYHDTPGISGYSPYKLVFGRDRHLAGVPYSGGTGKEAEEWFLEVRAREQEVREKTLALRQKRVERWNKRHRAPPVFGPDKGRIWYRHPPNKSSSLDPAWAGPMEVRRRIGETSYLIWTGTRQFTAHASMMKESFDPGFGAPVADLSYIGFAKRVKKVDEEPPDYEADCILGHRKVDGKWEFLTRWKGYRADSDSWEPLNHFFHRYSSDLVKYARTHDLGHLKVLEYLQTEPEGVAIPQPARRVPRGYPL